MYTLKVEAYFERHISKNRKHTCEIILLLLSSMDGNVTLL